MSEADGLKSVLIVGAGLLAAAFIYVQLSGVAEALRSGSDDHQTSDYAPISPRPADLQFLQSRQTIEVSVSMYSVGQADEGTLSAEQITEKHSLTARTEAAKECDTIKKLFQAECTVVKAHGSAGQRFDMNSGAIQEEQFTFVLQYRPLAGIVLPDEGSPTFEYVAAPLPKTLGSKRWLTDRLRDTRERRADYYRFLHKACDRLREEQGSCFLQGISISQSSAEKNHLKFEHRLLSNFAVLRQ